MRAKEGSVVLDKRSGQWFFYWWEAGKRRNRKIGTLAEFPSKTAAWRSAKRYREAVEGANTVTINKISRGPTIVTLAEAYRAEKMPKRVDTRRSYDVWLRNHVLPRWGASQITELQARPVELWLEALDLAPKSRVHIRGLLSVLWEFAMWKGDVPTQRNPMELVSIKGATKRVRRPRSLTPGEFQRFAGHLDQPFREMALLSATLGLRISECLALRWADVDWLGAKLGIERSIVNQNVDTVKTANSAKQMRLDHALLEMLKLWKQQTQFTEPEDWIFASPCQLGSLPWSYDQVWRKYQAASKKSGIGSLGTHSLRHSYRSWLDAVGTSIAVQQKMMRHASIVTTMDHYGDVVTDEMATAHSKVVSLAMNGM